MKSFHDLQTLKVTVSGAPLIFIHIKPRLSLLFFKFSFVSLIPTLYKELKGEGVEFPTESTKVGLLLILV